MNRTHLAAFHAVAEAGSFSRGAASLMVTQPAVSQHVADLEVAMGATLFDRLPRGVRLTAAGELLLGFARRIAAAEAEAEQAFAELRGLERGTLAIGASLTIGAYLLPRVLGEFRRRHPGIAVELDIANTETIEQKLRDGRFDLGLTEGVGGHASLKVDVFQQDELVAIAPPGHPVLERKSITAKAFCDYPFIHRERGSGTRAVIEHTLGRRGIRIEPVLSLGSTEAIKEAVIAGIGVAMVSKLAMAREGGQLAVVPLSDLKIVRPLHLLRSPQRVESRAAAAFLALLG